MRLLKCPINGARHRPPALAVLMSLPAGSKLALEPEPDNYVDRDAIGVYVSPKEIPKYEYATLRDALPNYGHDLDIVLSATRIFLGYCASSNTQMGQQTIAACVGSVGNVELGFAIAESGEAEFDCRLSFAESGQTIVVCTLGGK